MSVSNDNPGADDARPSLGLGCGGRNVDDDDDDTERLMSSSSSSAGGNSNLLTRSRTDIHLSVKQSFTFHRVSHFHTFTLRGK